MKPGQKGRIDAVDASQAAVIRLMVLGLVEDVRIQVENVAIGGDPIEISVYGSSVSIRKQDARLFQVSVDSANV
jgi:Fe2+ transport system protein FeoA